MSLSRARTSCRSGSLSIYDKQEHRRHFLFITTLTEKRQTQAPPLRFAFALTVQRRENTRYLLGNAPDLQTPREQVQQRNVLGNVGRHLGA